MSHKGLVALPRFRFAMNFRAGRSVWTIVHLPGFAALPAALLRHALRGPDLP